MSNLFLDTHAVLWAVALPERLSAPARDAIENADLLHVSSCCLHEIAVKESMGKLRPDFDLRQAMSELPAVVVAFDAAARGRYAGVAAALPAHRDPFDRAIAAHALSYADNALISGDPVFRRVPELTVVW